MEVNLCKEEFSYAYVAAVASVAGFSICRPMVDNDSIDIQFCSNKANSYCRSPRIEAQLKCTAVAQEKGKAVQYPLTIKNYNDLRAENVLVPRVLICVVLPSDSPCDWIDQNEEKLSLLRCGYWVSLNGYQSTNNSSSVTVEIPKEQIFDTGALTKLMANVGGY